MPCYFFGRREQCWKELIDRICHCQRWESSSWSLENVELHSDDRQNHRVREAGESCYFQIASTFSETIEWFGFRYRSVDAKSV